MRRTYLATALAVLAVAGAAVLALVPAASAQVGSGIGTCTTTTGTQDVGTVNVGQRFVLQVSPTCLFDPGSTVTATVNGVNVVGKVATANGQVLITITAVSSSQLSVDDPTITPAVCGVNTVTVTGPSSVAVGGVATQTATFTLNCAATATTIPVATPATPISGRLALTGANVLRFVAFALALLAVGAVAVTATRRRRAAAR